MFSHKLLCSSVNYLKKPSYLYTKDKVSIEFSVVLIYCLWFFLFSYDNAYKIIYDHLYVGLTLIGHIFLVNKRDTDLEIGNEHGNIFI